jgi:hypothetical protein
VSCRGAGRELQRREIIVPKSARRHKSARVALAARHALPAVSPLREAAAAGGLMSYHGLPDWPGLKRLASLLKPP